MRSSAAVLMPPSGRGRVIGSTGASFLAGFELRTEWSAFSLILTTLVFTANQQARWGLDPGGEARTALLGVFRAMVPRGRYAIRALALRGLAQGESGLDERRVGERLGIVAEMPAGHGIDLLGEEAQ